MERAGGDHAGRTGSTPAEALPRGDEQFVFDDRQAGTASQLVDVADRYGAAAQVALIDGDRQGNRRLTTNAELNGVPAAGHEGTIETDPQFRGRCRELKQHESEHQAPHHSDCTVAAPGFRTGPSRTALPFRGARWRSNTEPPRKRPARPQRQAST